MFLQLQSKSGVNSSDSADTGDLKASPPRHSSSKKEHLSSIVREISQARLISLRKKRSGQSMTLSISDNGNIVCDGSGHMCNSTKFLVIFPSEAGWYVIMYFNLSGD